ncbi:unnamed protein product [Protopolystoma xenopodis]|uniref:Uncharacterized protein n=1 Tax=Protopolystoma xenopodis TaxID=117903 RepID=A0A3S5B278_9PLAT|nr:unnamed protein product [Protopolystoma xenopodis]
MHACMCVSTGVGWTILCVRDRPKEGPSEGFVEAGRLETDTHEPDTLDGDKIKLTFGTRHELSSSSPSPSSSSRPPRPPLAPANRPASSAAVAAVTSRGRSDWHRHNRLLAGLRRVALLSDCMSGRSSKSRTQRHTRGRLDDTTASFLFSLVSSSPPPPPASATLRPDA